jgi:hypothetical protein
MADSSKTDTAEKEAAEREGEDKVSNIVLPVPPPTRSRIYPATSINIKRNYWCEIRKPGYFVLCNDLV